jgi:L-fuculokinase
LDPDHFSLKQPASLIFDIGKTTKKALLFDEHFHVLEERTECFAEILDDDGFPSEDIQALTVWVKEMVTYFSAHVSYYVSHINFSAYGASLINLDGDGNIIRPFYNYLKPLPEKIKKEFLDQFNIDGALPETTASPFLGLLNAGLQPYWLKRDKPETYKQIKTLLHFPQYFPYLITGNKFCEITSVGCHTMLWDFQKNSYHDWGIRENIVSLFPELQSPTHAHHHALNGRDIKVGIGVHDSSAALMPYLVTEDKPFLLLSTGTWNICFNPFDDRPLTKEELQQDCLCYMTFEGKPVKASRLFLGHEHEAQQKAMALFFKVAPDAYKSVVFNERLYKNISEDNIAPAFYPITFESASPVKRDLLKSNNYTSFNNFEEAQHALIRTLVQWQEVAIDLVDPEGKIRNIIVVGGFTKSPLFLEIMTRELKGRKIFISDHPRASALGAAWLVNGREKYESKRDLLKLTAL